MATKHIGFAPTISSSFTQVAPGIAAVGLVAGGVLIVLNYEHVTGSSSDWVALMPVIPLVGTLAGIVAARRNAARVAAALQRHDG